jgi:hypothetical protein
MDSRAGGVFRSVSRPCGPTTFGSLGITWTSSVLDRFESARPEDPRPRQPIEQARAWVRGEITMSQACTVGGHAMAAARDLSGAARHAADAAGQAGVVALVEAHELGAAASGPFSPGGVQDVLVTVLLTR